MRVRENPRSGTFYTILFSIYAEKKKKRKENNGILNFKMKFIENPRFISSSLSSLTDNLAKVLHSNLLRNVKLNLIY